MMVTVTNTTKDKVKVEVSMKNSSLNVRCPLTSIKETLFDNDTKCLIHLQKVNPDLEWGEFEIEIRSKVKEIPMAPSIHINIDKNTIKCSNCYKDNDSERISCTHCGSTLEQFGNDFYGPHFM